MKIGIDLDGVVIDSETTFRTYEEIFDIEVLKGNNLIDKSEPKFQSRYNWTEEQENNFIKNYLLKASNESNIMPGFKTIYKLLKEQKHEFIVITARGGFFQEMQDDAMRILRENDIEFMIDDDWKIAKEMSDNKIRTLYFRDTNLKKLDENQYIKEVNNWGEIYRIIKGGI